MRGNVKRKRIMKKSDEIFKEISKYEKSNDMPSKTSGRERKQDTDEVEDDDVFSQYLH